MQVNIIDARHEKTDLKVFWYDSDFSEFDSADIIDFILEKSVSHQKKDGRGHERPSFFWYDNDKDLNVCFLVTRVNYSLAKVHLDLTWSGQVLTYFVYFIFFTERSSKSFRCLG